jgi:hypothetical protein
MFWPACEGQLILLEAPTPVAEDGSFVFAPMLLFTKTPRVLLGVLLLSLRGCSF